MYDDSQTIIHVNNLAKYLRIPPQVVDITLNEKSGKAISQFKQSVNTVVPNAHGQELIINLSNLK